MQSAHTQKINQQYFKAGIELSKTGFISELFEIEELLKSDAELAIISSRLARSIRWLWEDILGLDQVVMTLRSESQKDKNYTLALILVEESAANILNVFNRAKAAVDAAASDSNEQRNAYQVVEVDALDASLLRLRFPDGFQRVPCGEWV